MDYGRTKPSLEHFWTNIGTGPINGARPQGPFAHTLTVKLNDVVKDLIVYPGLQHADHFGINGLFTSILGGMGQEHHGEGHSIEGCVSHR